MINFSDMNLPETIPDLTLVVSHNPGEAGYDAGKNQRTISRRAVLWGAVGTVGLAIAGCSGSNGNPNPSTSPSEKSLSPSAESSKPGISESNPPRQHEGLHDPVAQHRAAQVISTFENSTTK